MNKQKTSEFGKGFVYNLILFAKHWWYLEYMTEIYKKVGLENVCVRNWFNGASDHFYELEIPKQWRGKKIGRLAKQLQDDALEWGHGFKIKPTKEDFDKTFKKLEELARLIDKELGVESIEADYK